MKRPSASFVLPACLSVVFHAGVLVILPRFASPGGPYQMPAEKDTIVLRDPDPEPPPKIPEPEENPIPEFVVGDAEGKGFASNQIDDPVQATAPEADSDQAFLSLDPRGAGEKGNEAAVVQASGEGSKPGQPGGAPPESGIKVEDASAARLLSPFGVGQNLKFPRVLPKFTAPDNLIATESRETSQDDGKDIVAQTPESPPIPNGPDVELRSGEQTSAPPIDAAVAQVLSSNPGSPTAGGSQQPAADPARMSDSESDPFSQLGTVVFREGGLDIRAGRKIKTKRPKLLLAARIWDAIVIQHPEVTLQIDTDATGKVTSVVVLKSSGSNEIDQPTRVAVYDWWFEPKTDAQGKPVADHFKFVIGYR